MTSTPDDILINKASIIERCIQRMQEEQDACPRLDEYTHLDAFTLNVERACQASIDMAMHLVATKQLGIPQSGADAFRLLEENDLIPPDVARSMRAMTGFRNVAVHRYQELNPDVLHWVAESGPNHWVTYCQALGVSIQV